MFLVVALVLGRWWHVTLPGLLGVCVVSWVWLHHATNGALYGSGEQASIFWVVSGLTSAFAILVGVGLHNGIRHWFRVLRRRRTTTD